VRKKRLKTKIAAETTSSPDEFLSSSITGAVYKHTFYQTPLKLANALLSLEGDGNGQCDMLTAIFLRASQKARAM